MNKMTITGLLAACVLTACATLGGITKISDMTDEAFLQYVEDVGFEVGLVVQIALVEEDVTAEKFHKVADIIEEIATGTLKGSVAKHVELEGYAEIALILLLHDLDKQIVYDDFLSDREVILLLKLVEVLRV